MELSPYLQAIQNVSGKTPSEKYKTLNRIVQILISLSIDKSDTIQVQPSVELPEILIPLIKVEIAKIIQQPDEIVEALKSNDDIIFNRALQAKWFFNGSMKNITNVKYFSDRIFRFISVNKRKKLIKILLINLLVKKEYTIAENFYEFLLNMYEIKESLVLLPACSELFIWNTIIKRELVLSSRMVNKLYSKYPNLIVKYLNLYKPNDNPYAQNIHRIHVTEFYNFFPRLIKNNTNLFVELNDMLFGISKKLSRKNTRIILKKELDFLIKKPQNLMPIIDRKLVSSILTSDEFKLLFYNLYPISTTGWNNFSFLTMYNYLEFYPSEKKVPLILSTFKEIYGKNFIDFDEYIQPEVLQLLPFEDRVNVARKKLEKDCEWIKDTWNMESAWRCYLSITESITLLQNRINITSDADQRRALMEQMIYSCKINNDKNALLEVLQYIIIRHKNERGYILLEVIDRLLNYFQTQNLSIQHWNILDKIFQTLNVKDQLSTSITKRFFIAKIHFNIIQHLPIIELIKSYFNLKINSYHMSWNILINYPDYERICLDEFIKITPLLYPKDKSKLQLINEFLESIIDFNTRNSKLKYKIKPMIINDYSWLLTEIPQLVNVDSEDNNNKSLRYKLRECNLDLYRNWVKRNDDYKMLNLKSDKEFNEWKNNPEKIENNWEKYLEECKHEIHHKYARRFIKICRWHQNLPIKIANKCQKDIAENQCIYSIIVLAQLFEGPVFERIITPFLPSYKTISIESKDANKNYFIMQSILKSLSFVNPSVSLNVTLQFCTNDNIHMAANWILTSSKRTPVDKFLLFAMSLIDRPVSISKHFIRSFCIAANTKEIHNVLINLWRNEKYCTIRKLIFEKIMEHFISNSNESTWHMIKECINELTTNDTEKIESICHSFDKISNKYISNYVKQLLITLKKLSDSKNTEYHKSISSSIVYFLQIKPNIAFLFPEELHQEILQTFFTNLSLPESQSNAAEYYLINSYIEPANDKLELRLNFYSTMLIHILKNQWNVEDPHRPNFYPANYMIDVRMINLVKRMTNFEKRIKFIDITLKTFLTVLLPIEAPTFYSFYVFTSLYNQYDMTTKQYVNKIVETMPSLIEIFSEQFIPNFGPILEKCLKLLWNDSEKKCDILFDVIEYLLKLNNQHTTLLAATIPLPENIQSNEKRYYNIIQTIRQQNNSAAIANALMNFNCRNFYN